MNGMDRDTAIREARALRGPGPSLLPGGVPPNRSVWSTGETWDTPGTLLRDDDWPPCGDEDADRLWEMAGQTLEFLYDIYGWAGINGAATDLKCLVHTGNVNAFWNGDLLTVGDGDGIYFSTFLADSTVVAHEIGHGIIQNTINLDYSGQAGALNESFGDIFGVLAEQYALGHDVHQADWLVGKGVFTDIVQGQAIRSLKSPGSAYDDPRLGRDPQPSTMAGYQNLAKDNGGAHINSGIPNYAFYLAAMGVGGHAWEQVGRVWMDVVLQRLVHPKTHFVWFAEASVRAASNRFGPDSLVRTSVEQAWRTVGVLSG